MSHDPVRRPPLRRHAAPLLLATALAATAGAWGLVPGAPARASLASETPYPWARDSLTAPIVISSVPTVVGTDTIGILNVGLEVVLRTLDVPQITTRVDTADGNVDTVSIQTTRSLTLRAYKLVSVNDTLPSDTTAHFPGPTFQVSPGDSVRITLINNLQPVAADTSHGCMSYPATEGTAPTDTFPNCFHGPDWTNIHFHGFHITPNTPGDNVLLEIPPQSTFQYAFRIPLNQSPGTMWYHPHKHGSVALQVVNGMSGAFIIQGSGLDSLADSLNMREHLVAIQQVDSTVNLIDAQGAPEALINGQADPVIYMQPNEVQRWRIVNENVQLATNFKLLFDPQDNPNPPKLYDVARDGVQFAPANYSLAGVIPIPDPGLDVAPGSRLDVFVQAPSQPGRYLLKRRSNPGARARSFARQRSTGLPGAASDTVVLQDTALLVVEVGGTAPAAYNTVLPLTLPPLPSFLDSIQVSQITGDTAVVVFSDGGAPGGGATPNTFFLGSGANPIQQFNPGAVFVPENGTGKDTLPMVLGSAQIWKVQNASVNLINHPFHIHINPFQVVHVHFPQGAQDPNAVLYAELNLAAAQVALGVPGSNRIWLDVIPLPRPAVTNGVVTDTGYVVLAQRYDDFDCPDQGCGEATGWFVMHCHILGHEERGMMQVLEVVSPGVTPSPPPDSLVDPPGQISPLQQSGGGGGASHSHARSPRASPPHAARHRQTAPDARPHRH